MKKIKNFGEKINKIIRRRKKKKERNIEILTH